MRSGRLCTDTRQSLAGVIIYRRSEGGTRRAEFSVEDRPRVCFRKSRPDVLLDNRRRDLLSTRGIAIEEKALIGI